MLRGKTPTHITVRPLVMNEALEQAILADIRTDSPHVDQLTQWGGMALAIGADGQEYLVKQDGRCIRFDRYMFWEFKYSGPSSIPGQREIGIFDLKILPGRISGLLGEPVNFGDWIILIDEIELDNYERALRTLTQEGS